MCKRDHATVNGISMGKWGYRLFMCVLTLLAVIQLVVLYKLLVS